MAVDKPTSKVIVIDTEQYAGNFEREMCAYITGHVGECGVGADLANEVYDEIRNIDWFDNNVVNEPDDHGCYRPCSIWPTEGWYNNGNGKCFRVKKSSPEKRYPAYLSVAIFVESFPVGDVLAEIIERAKYFCEHRAEFSRFDKEKLTYTGIRFFDPKYELVEVKFDVPN